MLARLQTAASLSIVTALWCWVMTAGYGIWKFGYVDGYLAAGEITFPSTTPIGYLTFLMYASGAFGVTFVLAFAACALAPRHLHLTALIASWLIGATLAAVDLSFLFLDHGGGTWLATEALRAQFYHPIVTPFWVLVGLFGTASLTRRWRHTA